MEILNRQEIFKGKIIDVELDTVKLPNGKTAKREVVLHNAASGMLAVDNDGKILFVRQYRHPIGKELLELPAGIVEQGETPMECALREIEEETAHKAGNIELLTAFHTSAGFSNEVIYVYLCTGLTKGSFNFDEDEFITNIRLTLDEAIDKIFTGEITDSKTIIGLLCYKEKLARQQKEK